MLSTKVLPLLLSALLVAAVPQKHEHLHNRASDSSTEYEYVVIGSGPGGGPLASRLAIAGTRYS
ncbi:hypothetical protein CLAFUW4_20027 [Fulvia fulva]|uniref:uncharacterized protein n=1 Tax=Passalora fulva TaxID=5499 RepID=UPI002852665D|nr:uncharacterized protein CLAFUR5_20027 [Fulvia fulva]KAK4628710.1 hypothetical protein CLAFUR4_20027 [Fulvia fulva]KAK4630167.1 hypothetical protein CLAFUR0_20027 [Fulvia fulva]WMI38838.1 hypothetical protein CLAFUR5_20027 [Fulvia fulva]WPV12188.1 hypothetical protein CLAFUW4_20027 [Fulvia fulva]WPV27886.1 hypothetical protein CLAFUW7_20027 [Fulvia fulva]